MSRFIISIMKVFVRILPDALHISLQYYYHFHKFPNLKNPKTFNEKLQWLKLHDRRPEYTMMVDKYAVRKYIAETIGEEYLIPLVGGPWESVDEIDFDKLPDQFVLKCTHDSGSVTICRDKSAFDYNAAREKLSRALKRNAYWHGREWPYKNVPPRIIAEKYMRDERQGKLIDYKFFCFNGNPLYFSVSSGLENHATARMSVFDIDGNKTSCGRSDFVGFDAEVEIPKSFDEMKTIAKILSSDKAFFRVDLYEINKKVYFGELTFTPASGLTPFEPQEWDYKLGEWLVLQEKHEVLT